MALAEPLAECGRAVRDAHAHRVRRHPRRDGRGVPHRTPRARAGRRVAPQVRRPRELGTKRRGARRARAARGARIPSGCDAYPYTAGSSTLDLKQVTDAIEITITWSEPHPEVGGRSLKEIAREWDVSLLDAARRLQPAGAIYHSMSEDDVRRILRHPATVIGSDGLPNDPNPHPRLWGAFPRVLGRYARDERLFPLARSGAQDDRPAGAEVRACRPRRSCARASRRTSCCSTRDRARRGDVHRSAAARRGDPAVWVNGVLVVARAGGDRRARRAVRGARRDRSGGLLRRHSPRRRRRHQRA